MPGDPIISRLARLPYRAWLLIVFCALLAISAIDPPHPTDFLFEHILTAAALGLIAWLELDRWRAGRAPMEDPRGLHHREPPASDAPLSNASYTLVFIYMLLHVLGAHYTYSEVPYDRWFTELFGVRVSDLIGAESYQDSGGGPPRNHYDRLVHFSFGLLLLRPASELMGRWLGLASRRQAIIVAAGLLCVFGTLYEILEWLYAEVVGAEAAELYNGQQGDMFDAHKDVALNIIGSVIAGLVMGASTLMRKSTAPP